MFLLYSLKWEYFKETILTVKLCRFYVRQKIWGDIPIEVASNNRICTILKISQKAKSFSLVSENLVLLHTILFKPTVPQIIEKEPLV